MRTYVWPNSKFGSDVAYTQEIFIDFMGFVALGKLCKVSPIPLYSSDEENMEYWPQIFSAEN